MRVVEVARWPEDPVLDLYDHSRPGEEPEEAVRAVCWGRVLVLPSLVRTFAGTH